MDNSEEDEGAQDDDEQPPSPPPMQSYTKPYFYVGYIGGFAVTVWFV